MYTVRIEDTFAAAHHIRNYHGKCENIHGHNYKVRIYVKGPKLDKGGMLIDFAVLKRVLKSVLDELDHADLNTITFFAENEPSAERISEYIFKKLKPLLPDCEEKKCALFRVEVFETDINMAVYEED